jgi:hypothetical protein
MTADSDEEPYVDDPNVQYFGIHDYWDGSKWCNYTHWHEYHDDIFFMGLTRNGDGFGESVIMRDEDMTDEPYESFRYGGYVSKTVLPEKPNTDIRPGKYHRDDMPEYFQLTET